MLPIQRVQDILLKPKETWPAIEQESASVASIYNGYVIWLAAIPAIAGFIGMSIVGFGGAAVSLRVPILTGLVNMVVGYAVSLALVYVFALIVDALAPTFGGTKNPIAALKVAAYAATAAFVGGVFNLLPALATLGLLAALYSIYLLYTGLPVLMRCPQDKAIAYTAVVIVACVVLSIVIGAVLGRLIPARGLGGITGMVQVLGVG